MEGKNNSSNIIFEIGRMGFHRRETPHKIAWWTPWHRCITLDMRLLAWIIVLFVVIGGVHPEPPVTFCDLVRNPEKYNGQEVSVRATYRYGFEWSELYCLDCLDKGKAWLATGSLDDASARFLKRAPGAGIVNLTVQGVFVSGGTFGHRTGYRYRIEAHKISSVAVIQKGTKPPAEEEKAEKHWGCGGTDPK
jgi:hypothetical protein